MKLLVDEKLPPRVVREFAGLFPYSIHVSEAGLGSSSDITIWDFAKANHFAFLTKDKDFANLSIAKGTPPKVILLQTGNCSTAEVIRIIRNSAVRFSDFDGDPTRSLLVLR